MPRTTSELVEGIVEVADGVNLDPYILMANELVTEICAPSGYTSERLEVIERLLAAHYYCVYDPRSGYEQAGPTAESKQYRLGLFLAVTMYGQQAMGLDTAGGLSRLNKETEKGTRGRVVSLSYVGTVPTPPYTGC